MIRSAVGWSAGPSLTSMPSVRATVVCTSVDGRPSSPASAATAAGSRFITAGMAAKRPAAVAINASEIPGPTIARFVEPVVPIR